MSDNVIICGVCDEVVKVENCSNGYDLFWSAYTCKCGRLLDHDFWPKQKYANLIKKYGTHPELLTEILSDLEKNK